MVLGLNTVCDVYFAGSIDLLCDAWDLTPDVAGATCLHQILLPPILLQSFIICSILQPFARAKATWMAAGGSAPEFFTSIIGATIVTWKQISVNHYQNVRLVCLLQRSEQWVRRRMTLALAPLWARLSSMYFLSLDCGNLRAILELSKAFCVSHQSLALFGFHSCRS